MSAAYTWVQDEPRRLCAKLTPLERDVLVLMSKGLSNKGVGQHLGCAAHTVNSYCRSLYQKLDVHTVQEAAVIAAKAGLV